MLIVSCKLRRSQNEWLFRQWKQLHETSTCSCSFSRSWWSASWPGTFPLGTPHCFASRLFQMVTSHIKNRYRWNGALPGSLLMRSAECSCPPSATLLRERERERVRLRDTVSVKNKNSTRVHQRRWKKNQSRNHKHHGMSHAESDKSAFSSTLQIQTSPFGSWNFSMSFGWVSLASSIRHSPIVKIKDATCFQHAHLTQTQPGKPDLDRTGFRTCSCSTNRNMPKRTNGQALRLLKADAVCFVIMGTCVPSSVWTSCRRSFPWFHDHFNHL